jgi:hypothetical protein
MSIEKRAAHILVIFGVLIWGIILGARAPYVPLADLEYVVLPYSSLLIFFALILMCSIYKGTTSKPAGFRYLANIYKEGNYKQFLYSLFAIPASSCLMGAFTYMLVATLPAYPTKFLMAGTAEAQATCIQTGRDKARGSWSMFLLKNGEEWTVPGFGHVCPKEQRSCLLTFTTGTAGYFVHKIKCN